MRYSTRKKSYAFTFLWHFLKESLLFTVCICAELGALHQSFQKLGFCGVFETVFSLHLTNHPCRSTFAT